MPLAHRRTVAGATPVASAAWRVLTAPPRGRARTRLAGCQGLPVLELSAWLRPEMPRMKVLLSADFALARACRTAVRLVPRHLSRPR